ncbi:MAG: tetratricopeptide repeat protein [Candidatus Dadabacteria bacterium]|nr:tetratricopeptide repeat protein [Candidatus Dadabacteria bacterium]
MNLGITAHSFARLFLLRITITLLSILILICYTTLPINAQNSAEEYFISGVGKLASGDYKGALSDYNMAIELDPNGFPWVYENRAGIRSNLGDNAGAMEDFNKAIELDPNYALAYHNRGITKSDLGDKRGAVQDYNKAILLDSF